MNTKLLVRTLLTTTFITTSLLPQAMANDELPDDETLIQGLSTYKLEGEEEGPVFYMRTQDVTQRGLRPIKIYFNQQVTKGPSDDQIINGDPSMLVFNEKSDYTRRKVPSHGIFDGLESSMVYSSIRYASNLFQGDLAKLIQSEDSDEKIRQAAFNYLQITNDHDDEGSPLFYYVRGQEGLEDAYYSRIIDEDGQTYRLVVFGYYESPKQKGSRGGERNGNGGRKGNGGRQGQEVTDNQDQQGGNRRGGRNGGRNGNGGRQGQEVTDNQDQQGGNRRGGRNGGRNGNGGRQDQEINYGQGWQGGKRKGGRNGNGGRQRRVLEIIDSQENTQGIYHAQNRKGGAQTQQGGNDQVIMEITAQQPDIIFNKVGNALLDSLRPDLFNDSAQAGVYHKAWSETNTFLTLLSLGQLRQEVIAQTRGRLDKSSFITNMGERSGFVLSDVRYGLWDIGTDIKLDQAKPEVHELSRVLSGAIYDVMSDAFADANQQSNNPEDALRQITDYMRLKWTYTATQVSSEPSFSEVGKIFSEAFDGKPYEAISSTVTGLPWQTYIQKEFTKRNIPVTESETYNWGNVTGNAWDLADQYRDSDLKRVQSIVQE